MKVTAKIGHIGKGLLAHHDPFCKFGNFALIYSQVTVQTSLGGVYLSVEVENDLEGQGPSHSYLLAFFSLPIYICGANLVKTI